MVGGGLRELASPLRERSVRLLWGSQLVSELGDWAARIAVAALVYQRTDSPALAGAAFVAGLLPWLGPGQVLAALADRYSRRGLMIATDLVRAGLFLMIAALPLPTWAVIVATAAAGLATAPFEAARSAGLVEFTSAERLPAAIRLSAATYDAGTVLGYAASGLLLAVATAAWACALNAVTFLVSAILIAGLPRNARAVAVAEDHPGPESEPARESLPAGVARATTALWSDPLLRAAALLGVLPVAAGTALGGQSVAWAASAFPGEPWLPGMILSGSTGVCLVLTVLLGPRSAPWATLRLAALLAAGAAVVGAGLCASARPIAVAGALIVTGVFFVPIVLAQTVIAPRLAPERRATSFGLLMGLLTLAQALASPLLGLLVSAVGAPQAFALACAATALLALALVARRATPDGSAPAQPPVEAGASA